MAKFYVSNVREDETNNTYYFITFKDENNEEIDIVDDIADEIGIPVEVCLDIYEKNGAVEIKGITDCKDLFLNNFQAQNALQEILEFAVEFNQEDDECFDCSECEGDCSDLIPAFPEQFQYEKEDISDKEINEIIKLMICDLENNQDGECLEVTKKSNLIQVRRIRNCDNPDCPGFYEYDYSVKVCKDVYTYNEFKEDDVNYCID